MAGAALTHATRRPELYTEAQMRRLQADALAEQVRLASMPTRNEADRFAIADRVLARYDTLIPAWSTQGDETRDDVIRARIDRLHALHARYRMRDLASEYEALRAEGVAVPRYALGDVASAYLYLRQPEQAAAIYQQVAQAEESHDDDPVDRLGNQTGRYYSLAEAEDFDGASQVMDETREGYPAWVYVKGQPMRIPNDLHLQSMQVDAGARLQADDTPEAQARLEGMARNAPNNSTLKSELAALYRARSLPRLGADAENGRNADAAQHRRGERPGLHRPGPAGVAPGRGAQPGHAGARAREPAVAPAGARMGGPQQGRAAHRRLPWPGL